MTLMGWAKQAGTSLKHGGKAMAGSGEIGESLTNGRWRIGLWILGGAVLMIPAVAMQYTDEVDWSAFDFVLAGAMIFGTLGLFEIAARISGKISYRAASGLALFTGLLLVWNNLAVGVIGNENNPANLMYLGLLVAGAAATVFVGFRARGMSWVVFGIAGGQALIGMIAIVGGMGLPASGAFELLWLSAFFCGLWLVSAWLFRIAAAQDAAS